MLPQMLPVRLVLPSFHALPRDFFRISVTAATKTATTNNRNKETPAANPADAPAQILDLFFRCLAFRRARALSRRWAPPRRRLPTRCGECRPTNR
jgi:hypothetical protein